MKRKVHVESLTFKRRPREEEEGRLCVIEKVWLSALSDEDRCICEASRSPRIRGLHGWTVRNQ
jgi:hypothetical protein